MSDTATQLGTLLERSPAASASEAAARAAIEHAVSELIDALRNHHGGTADHSNRLAVDCRRVGLELGLRADFVFELELVAILHDIGKLAVPDTILDLPRPLSGRERAMVRSHTISGAEILTEIAACGTSPRSCARATSAGTGPATRTGCWGSRYRSHRGSCSRSTRSTR